MAAKKTTEIRMLGDVRKPSVQMVAREKCVTMRNVREASSYRLDETKADKDLLTSLAVNGQLPGQLLVVSRTTDKDGNECYEVLKGNRRLFMMNCLHAGKDIHTGKELPAIKLGDKQVVKQRDFDTIECLVYDNLSIAQENQIRNDHAGVAGLTDWERYVQAVQLWNVPSATAESVASQMGFQHGTAQRLLWISRMHPDVEMDYYRKCHKEANLGVTMPEIGKLNTAWLHDANLAPGNSKEEKLAYMKGKFGPESQQLWDSWVARAEARKSKDGSDETTDRKAKTKKDFDQAAEQFRDDDILSGFFRWAGGHKDADIFMVIKLVKALRDAALAYMAENEALKARITELETELSLYRPADKAIDVTYQALPAPSES